MRRLDPARTALLLVDWQERLFDAMPTPSRDEALRHAADLRWLTSEMGIPVVVSEQYPKGLGPTVGRLKVGNPVEKITFSAMETEAFADRVRALDRPELLVSGMETHICVAQTCRDLVAAGYGVWLVADACLSRRRIDWDLGVEHIRADGASVVTAEAAMFELLGRAGSPLFKELSRRIR